MTGDVIKSFLVGLGFGVDDASLAKFNKSIKDATLRVTALYGSINATAGAIVYGVSKISESFEAMGYELHLIAPAINRAIILRQELFRAYSSAGVNIVKAAQASVKLNLSLERTKIVLKAIYSSVGAKFFDLLRKQSDVFRQKLYQNMPKIQNVLERFVKFVFKALDAVTQLGVRLWSILTRVYDFFVMLDKATDGWSTIILGVIAAWQLLNLEFLATPLGMLLAGFVAILALFDDFKTWQEGGKSLFDWTNALSSINAALTLFESLRKVLEDVFDVLGDVVAAFYHLFTADFSGFADSLVSAFKNILKTISDVFTSMGRISQFVEAAGGALSNLLTGNAPANLQSNPAGTPLANPVGSAAQNSLTNQNVSQQTQINVMGSADANAVGKAVAGEQNRVNFDMTRNMKGSTR